MRCASIALRRQYAYRLTRKKRFDVFDRVGVRAFIKLPHTEAQMRRQYDIGQTAQGMVIRQRLLRINIQARARDALPPEGIDERSFIDQWSACRIHEDCGGLHQRKLACTDDSARTLTEHKMNGEHIAQAE